MATGIDKSFNIKNGLTVNTNLIWANNGQVGFNTTTPNANVSVVGTANVSGNVAIGGNESVNGSLSVIKSGTFSNTISVTGNATFSNTLSVASNTTIGGFANISGTLTALGNTTLGNRLTVANTTIINGPTTVNSVMTCTNTSLFVGNSNFSNTVDIVGYIKVGSTANVTSTLGVGGATTLYSTLTAYDATSLYSTLNVNNATTLSNTLAVTGATTLANTVVVTGNGTFSNALNVVGNTTLGSSANVNINLNVAGNVSILQRLVTVNTVNFSNTLTVTGLTTLNNGLTVYNTGSFINAVSIFGPATLANTLSVSGNTVLLNTANLYGATTVANTLNVNNATTLANTLAVTGATTLSNTVNIAGNVAITSSGVPLQFAISNSSANSTITPTTITTTDVYGTIRTTSQPYVYANNTTWVGSTHQANVVSNAYLQSTLAFYFSSINNSIITDIGVFGVGVTAGYGNFAGPLKEANNQVLHAGNYNSYSPSLTGTGASGSWPISITGSANTVTNISSGQITTALGYTPLNPSVPITLTQSAPATGFGYFVTSAYGSVGDGRTYFGYNTGSTYVNYIRGAGGTFCESSTFQVANNQVLHAGNYNSYSPSLTGTGASGTWGINVTGNASTATLANKASTLAQNGGSGAGMTFFWSGQAGQPSWLWGSNDGSNHYVYNPANFNVNNAVTTSQTSWYALATTGQLNCTGSQYTAIGTATSSLGGIMVQGGGGATAAFMSFHRPGAYASYFGLDTDNQWKVGGWSAGAVAYTLLHSGNYTSYSPSLTGSGATGSWNINITGNAATATSAATWTTTRTITIGSTAKSVNGSSNVSWSLGEIGAAASNQTMYIGTTAVAINRSSGSLTLSGVNADTATNATNLNSFYWKTVDNHLDSYPTYAGSADGYINFYGYNHTGSYVRNTFIGTGTGLTNTLFFSADRSLYCYGNITAYYTSDIRLKENIRPILNAIDKVKAINGVYFDWKDEVLETRPEDWKQKEDVGVIAQEIQAVLPEVVDTRDDGTLAVNYEKIVPLLIEAIKEQQIQIEKLKENR